MTETGTVTKIDGPLVTISVGAAASCAGCKSPFCNTAPRTFLALNKKKLELESGDRVELFLAPEKAIGASFLVLIMPLLAFLALHQLAGLFFPQLPEWARFLSGLLGLSGGFFIAWFVGTKKKDFPTVTRKLETEGEEALACHT